jgi:hypothetical protein
MKEFIGGKRISRKEAYKGLGNPKNWESEKQKILNEFKAKPTISKKVSKTC